MIDKGPFTEAFFDNMYAMGFRLSKTGIGMTGTMEGVHISACEGPTGTQFIFTQIGERSATQFDVMGPGSGDRQALAKFIVDTFASNFPHLVGDAKEKL